MLQPWVQGTVIKIENATSLTKRFWIQIPAMDKFDFEPGQFVTLDLPIHEQKNKRWRSYSIASWPDGTNVFELVIVLLEGGAGTTYLFNETQVGSEITLRGPQGVFTMPAELNRDIYLVCTGTGIAPFRSMAHHILNHHIPHQHIYVIFGCRRFRDALYKDELEQLQQQIDSFTYMPTYSREEKTTGIYTGYVHQVYQDLVQQKSILNESTGLMEPAPALFYLCGWKQMIDEARQRLQLLGYDKKSIHFELYG